jgi:hypothetical protein
MPLDTKYQAVPLIYRSRGLTARPAQDQAGEFVYLNMMNCLERSENAMSSRYGTQIINRDPTGGGTSNHFFATPIVSLGRLVYLSNSYRYASSSDGNLWRRAGDTQGAYSSIYTGLSGKPFQFTVTNCFLTAQPYIFIYDQNVSLKDTGTLVAPQLTGMDPSPYTVNATPYSPLLTLIDNFNSGNSYTTSGFSVGWAYNAVSTLSAASGQTVTDFSEFFGVQPSGAGSYTIAGGTTSATANPPNTSTNSNTYSGFTSAVVTGTETVSLQVTLSGGGSGLPGRIATISVDLDYSIDSGATWTSFYSQSGPENTFWGGAISQSILGLTNIDTLEIRANVSVTAISGSTSVVSATLAGITAIIASPDVFGQVTNGMLSVLGSASPSPVQIASIVSSGLVGELYTELTITTQTAHSLTGTPSISIYGSSNDLTDGFYTATVTGATTLTVPYSSAVPIGSTGGILYGGATSPATCVLTNEYSNPYPTQMSAWGFYQQVPTNTTSFPIGSWQGTVAQNTTATVGVTVPINLNINNQATDDDLIVLTIAVGNPSAISNIRLQFDINGSGYTTAYYYKDISPAYYQQNVQQLEDAYTATSQQIFADTLGLLTGQPPNSINSQLQPGNLSTGQGSWQTIYLRRGDFLPVGIAGESGSDWAAVSGWQLVITTNTVGSSTVSVNGLYFQWGYGPSSFGGVGYDYRVTPYNAATGTEGNATPIQKFDPQFGYLASLVAPIFLRQAVQITGQYYSDPQVTHLRLYRRGGNLSANWFQIDQVPNITAGGQFIYKDVIPDAVLTEAQPLILDNDPPVTSSLQFPINTTLSAATASPGSSIYSQFIQQTITVEQSSAIFVPEQIVLIGYPTNLEEIRVIAGGTGSFTAIVRLQHNAGEPVIVSSIPRQPCNLVAQAYGQVWLAGDPNNPHYLYFSKRARPENFGPQNYIPVGSPSDPINAIINWRGTLFVGTLTTWYQIIGGPQPYSQPTGSKHGVVAQQGWAQTESAVWYFAADGLREFQGADGRYMTLPVEMIFRAANVADTTPVPLANLTQLSFGIMAYYNNIVYASYVSTSGGGVRYRLNYDTQYLRYRSDDVGATAMLWEQDTNTLLVAKQLASGPNIGSCVIVQDQIGDYDDGGWSSGALFQVPIAMTIQTPYTDLGQPHYPKQFNTLEVDVNTQSQLLNTTLLFNTEPPSSLVLATYTGDTLRHKKQLQIALAGAPQGSGLQAYSMSIQHTMSVTTAPTLFQENIYAAVLADYRTSFDTYWLKFGTDESKIVRQCYFDYTSTAPITINLYADGSSIPYYTFTLPAEPTRLSVRELFPAWKPRLWRMIGICTGDYQFWANPVLDYKPVKMGSTWTRFELLA